MFETVRNAFKIKDLRKKILYTLFILVVVRIGCQLPIPGVDADYISQWFADQNSLDFFNQLTGGSFEKMSIFALNITPYITSSIILQLLTIAIPRLEELHKDGEEGRKKISEYTRYVTIVLSLMESAAMAIGFASQDLLTGGATFTSITVCIVSMTAGSALLMWLGEQITEHGVGNGISIILLYNIVSRMPEDMSSLFNKFVKNASTTVNSLLAAVIIIGVLVAMVVFIIYLSDGERRISVQYSQKTRGRKLVGGQSSHIPLKVNTAGVIPVIFASSLMAIPSIITSLFGKSPSGVGAKILQGMSQSYWFNANYPWGFLGLAVYILLVFFFAYFYTAITFNPMEIANNMKKSGGFVPGIRPGKPTQDYLNKILNYIIFIGAVGLLIVAMIPMFFNGFFSVNVSFGGTSIIIVVGVVIETMKSLESQMLVRHYQGFLLD